MCRFRTTRYIISWSCCCSESDCKVNKAWGSWEGTPHTSNLTQCCKTWSYSCDGRHETWWTHGLTTLMKLRCCLIGIWCWGRREEHHRTRPESHLGLRSRLDSAPHDSTWGFRDLSRRLAPWPWLSYICLFTITIQPNIVCNVLWRCESIPGYHCVSDNFSAVLTWNVNKLV